MEVHVVANSRMNKVTYNIVHAGVALLALWGALHFFNSFERALTPIIGSDFSTAAVGTLIFVCLFSSLYVVVDAFKRERPNKKDVATGEQRAPGLTGTGKFIENIHWMLWGDLHSPGLIDRDRFYELRETALPPEEHRRLSLALVSGHIVSFSGQSHTSPDEKKSIEQGFGKVDAYLRNIRDNDYDKLKYWLGDNFFLHKDGWVKDQHETKISRDILDVISAYLNCLNYWGFKYTWTTVQHGAGESALLVSRAGCLDFCLCQSEVNYVQGKPYRFVIDTTTTRWSFDDSKGRFSIRQKGPTERKAEPLIY
jgi:hypothetical protein